MKRPSATTCNRPQPSATYRPPAPAAEPDRGRTRIGNTPTCEDCGESLDHCTCGDDLAPAATQFGGAI